MTRSKLLLIDPFHRPINADIGAFRFDVTHVTEATEARRLLVNERFDVIVMEILLPEIPQQGIQIIEDLRHDRFAANDRTTPVVVYTMIVDSAVVQRVRTLDARYLARPLFTDVLLAEVEAAIAMR